MALPLLKLTGPAPGRIAISAVKTAKTGSKFEVQSFSSSESQNGQKALIEPKEFSSEVSPSAILLSGPLLVGAMSNQQSGKEQIFLHPLRTHSNSGVFSHTHAQTLASKLHCHSPKEFRSLPSDVGIGHQRIIAKTRATSEQAASVEELAV